MNTDKYFLLEKTDMIFVTALLVPLLLFGYSTVMTFRNLIALG